MYSIVDLTKLQGRGLPERILDGKKIVKLINLIRTGLMGNGETGFKRGELKFFPSL